VNFELVTFKMHKVLIWPHSSQRDLPDLNFWTSKSNKFIFVSNFPQAVIVRCIYKLLV